MKRIETLTLRYLDGELSADEVDELDALLANDVDARALHLRLLEAEAALRSQRQSVDVASETMRRIERDLGERVEQRVLGEISSEEDGAGADEQTAEGEVVELWPWLMGRRLWLAAAAMVLSLMAVAGGRWLWGETRTAAAEEVLLFGQKQLRPGAPVAYRVLLRNGQSGAALAQRAVKLALYDSSDAMVWETSVHTDPNGYADFRERLPANTAEGAFKLRFDGGEPSLRFERNITVKRSYKIYVSTDKPLYQPGQTIFVRALALDGLTHRPVDAQPISIEIADAKSNKVLRKRMTSSSYGLVNAELLLADQVNMGDYTVTATLGDTASKRTVHVKRYTLPKFKVELQTDQPWYAPKAKLVGRLRANYTFGEHVAGAEVLIAARPEVAGIEAAPLTTQKGVTDDNGDYRFELELPQQLPGNALHDGHAAIVIDATVQDKGGNEATKQIVRVVSAAAIQIDAVFEAGMPVDGVDNHLFLAASYPDGTPAPCTFTLPDFDKSEKSDSAGVARIELWPSASRRSLTVVARDEEGRTGRLRIDKKERGELLLRPDRAIYDAGATVKLDVRSTDDDGDVMWVDLIQDGQRMTAARIELSNGEGRAVFDLPPEVFGTVQLQAYRVTRNGRIHRTSRVIQVRRDDALAISAKLDRDSYRPGETAKIELSVTDRDHQPVAAALSLAAVDEAVFALNESRPGLERAYFALQEQLLKPRVELHHRQLVSDEPLLADNRAGDDVVAATRLAGASGADQVLEPGGDHSYQARRLRLELQQKRERRWYVGALALLPVGLLSLLMLGISIVGVALGGRAQKQDHLPVSATRRVVLAWSAGVMLPMGMLALGASFRSQAVALGGTILAVIVALAVQRVAYQRLLSLIQERTGGSRLYLAMTRALPGLYLLAALAVLLLIWAASSRVLREDAVVTAVLWLVAGFSLCLGGVTAAGRALLKGPSWPGTAWVFCSRISLACLPFIVMGSLLFVRAGSEELAAPVVTAGATGLRPQAQAAIASRTVRTETAGEGHRAGAGSSARVRRYFPETLHWEPQLITDASGRASLQIPLADSITAWRLALSAVSARGELGATNTPIKVFQPFFIEPNLPVELTQNDVVTIPIAVFNYLDTAQSVDVEIATADWLRVTGGNRRTLRLGPREVSQASFEVTALRAGEHELRVDARGADIADIADAVVRKLRVKPDGIEMVEVHNGQLQAGAPIERAIEVPPEAIEGGHDLFVKITPSAFSQVVDGMDSVFAMPHGCFEQTSSVTYPSVLALGYLRATKQIRPDVEMTAVGYINAGYQRLLSFEVRGGGFEWFGKSPAHNVLTAYGLMEFSDMHQVFPIDTAVINRTRRWLLNQQQDDGSWRPTSGGIREGAINQYQNDLKATAYIAWALASTSTSPKPEPAVTRALDLVAQKLTDSDDSYAVAVAANALVAADHFQANAMLSRLDSLKQVKNSHTHWAPEGSGVTHSRGQILAIETTALAAHAFVKARRPAVANSALAWLVTQKDARGTWHSTQATVAAMRALLAGTAGAGAQLDEPLDVVVSVDGEPVHKVRVTPDTADVSQLVSLGQHAASGDTSVALRIEGKGSVGYQIVAKHYLPGQPDEARKPLRIEVSYDTTELTVGEELRAVATVRYDGPGNADMIMVDLGVPPGFVADAGALEALKKQQNIERYELTGSQITLYLRKVARGAVVKLPYRMRSTYPVRAKAPAARTYQYYQPSVRDRTDAVNITVTRPL